LKTVRLNDIKRGTRNAQFIQSKFSPGCWYPIQHPIKMFSWIFLASALISLGVSVPTEVGRQAPVTIRPEGESEGPIITTFHRLESLESRDIPILPKSYLPRGDVPQITPKQSSSCSGVNYAFTASGQSAYLQSQNYPLFSYPRNLDCSYTITSPPGTQMTIQCNQFNVACPNDYLSFSLDGSSNSTAYCGLGIIPAQSTSGSLLTVGFHSGSSRPFSLLPYTYQCTITVKGTEGSTTPSPGTSTTLVPLPPVPGNCTCGVRNVNGVSLQVNTILLFYVQPEMLDHLI
jgi:hypothetical protein